MRILAGAMFAAIVVVALMLAAEVLPVFSQLEAVLASIL